MRNKLPSLPGAKLVGLREPRITVSFVVVDGVFVLLFFYERCVETSRVKNREIRRRRGYLRVVELSYLSLSPWARSKLAPASYPLSRMGHRFLPDPRSSLRHGVTTKRPLARNPTNTREPFINKFTQCETRWTLPSVRQLSFFPRAARILSLPIQPITLPGVITYPRRRVGVVLLAERGFHEFRTKNLFYWLFNYKILFIRKVEFS